MADKEEVARDVPGIIWYSLGRGPFGIPKSAFQPLPYISATHQKKNPPQTTRQQHHHQQRRLRRTDPNQSPCPLSVASPWTPSPNQDQPQQPTTAAGQPAREPSNPSKTPAHDPHPHLFPCTKYHPLIPPSVILIPARCPIP